MAVWLATVPQRVLGAVADDCEYIMWMGVTANASKRRFAIYVLLSIFLLPLGDGDAVSATIAVKPGVSGRSIPLIQISGELKTGDSTKFQDALAHTGEDWMLTVGDGGTKLIQVELDSPGGNLAEAMKIGQLIRENAAFVRVGKDQVCASACVFILIAGVQRTIIPSAKIIIHRPHFEYSEFAELSVLEARKTYERAVLQAKQYFAEMGGDDRLFRLLMQTPSDGLRMLSAREITDFGIRGTDSSFEELETASRIKDFGPQGAAFLKGCQARARTGAEASDCFLRAKQMKNLAR